MHPSVSGSGSCTRGHSLLDFPPPVHGVPRVEMGAMTLPLLSNLPALNSPSISIRPLCLDGLKQHESLEGRHALNQLGLALVQCYSETRDARMLAFHGRGSSHTIFLHMPHDPTLNELFNNFPHVKLLSRIMKSDLVSYSQNEIIP
jgi:hypothetical protein